MGAGSDVSAVGSGRQTHSIVSADLIELDISERVETLNRIVQKRHPKVHPDDRVEHTQHVYSHLHHVPLTRRVLVVIDSDGDGDGDGDGDCAADICSGDDGRC